MSVDDEVRGVLARALTTIGNLQACAQKRHRYNQATSTQAQATLHAIAALLEDGPEAERSCLALVSQCGGYVVRCRCGWEQHHAHAMSARDDGAEHERNAPTPDEPRPTVPDLMAALEDSLAAAKADRDEARP